MFTQLTLFVVSCKRDVCYDIRYRVYTSDAAHGKVGGAALAKFRLRMRTRDTYSSMTNKECYKIKNAMYILWEMIRTALVLWLISTCRKRSKLIDTTLYMYSMSQPVERMTYSSNS